MWRGERGTPFRALENYAIESSISGDLDQLQAFDSVALTDVQIDGKIFSALTNVTFDESEVMSSLEYFGEKSFLDFPAGTVLHYAADGATDLLELVNPSRDQLINNASLNVRLGGGDVRSLDEDPELSPGDYWFEAPADEVVVEVVATDNEGVHDIIMTAAIVNEDTLELDVVVTTFELQIVDGEFTTVVQF